MPADSRESIHVVAVAVIAALLPTASVLADFTWNGGGADQLWTNRDNWDIVGPPTFDVMNMSLIFGPTGAAQSPDAGTDDYTNIANILFTNADASLTLTGTGSLTFINFGTITNDSTITQTVNIDLIATGSNFLLFAQGADLTIGGDIDLGVAELSAFSIADTLVSGVISGAGGSMLKTGVGTLTLTGANTYDGGTELNTGTIVLGNDSALGTGDLMVTGDSTLRSNNNGRSVANDVVINPAVTLGFDGSSSLTLAGVISGDGAIGVNADADNVALTLSGDNTYTGGTTLTRGTIALGHDTALGTGALTVAGNSSVRSTDDARSVGNDVGLNTGTTLTFRGSNDLELSGVISGDGALSLSTDSQDDALTLSGPNTYTGGTSIARGTIVLGDDNALGTGALNVVGDGTIQSSNDARVVANDASIDATRTLTFSGANNLELGGVISGDGQLGISADAPGVTLKLSGANTYTGGTTLTQGTVVLGDDTALGTGVLSIDGDSTLQSDDDLRVVANDATIADMVTLTVSGGNDLELGGVIGGSGALVIDTDLDTNVVTLSGNNTYSGGTTLTQGTIEIGKDDALGTGDLDVAGNGSIRSDANGNDLSNNINIADMTSLTFTGDNNLGFNGRLSGEGSLVVNAGNAGVKLRLFGNNINYTSGITLMRGTLRLGNDNALGAAPDPDDPMNQGSVLTLAGNGAIESRNNDRLIDNNIELGANTLTVTGEKTMELAGIISGAGGVVNVNLDTPETTLLLTGVNTYSGGTVLTGGTLILVNDEALGTGDISMAGDAAIQAQNFDVTINKTIDNGGSRLTISGTRPLTLTNTISGAGGLTLDTVNRLTTLSGLNSYTGDTIIDAGTLFLDSSGILTSAITLNDTGFALIDGQVVGAVTVNDGGWAGGSGLITGNLTNLLGGTVSPGGIFPEEDFGIGTPDDSIGMLFVGGNYQQETGSTLLVELDAATLTNDLIAITGTAMLEADSTIEAAIIEDGYIPSNHMFNIITASTVTDMGAIVDLDNNSATVRFEGTVLGGLYNLQLMRDADAYSAAADPGNNTSIGTGLDSLIQPADNNPTGEAAGLLAQLDALDAAAYNTAVSQLSPGPYSALTATGIENIRDFSTQQVAYLAAKRSGYQSFGFTQQVPGPPPGSMALANDDPLILAVAMAQAQDTPEEHRVVDRRKGSTSRWGRYIKLQGIFMDRDSSVNRTGFTSSSFGGQVGVDYSFSQDLIAGLAFSYAFTGADLKLGLGRLNDNTLRAGPYMTYSNGDWFVDASATFAWHFYNGDRNIPALGLSADSSYNGWDAMGYLGTGYYFEVAKDLRVTPMASLLYGHFEYGSFTETGAGGANLSVSSRSVDSLRSRLGAALSYRIDWNWKPIPYVYAGWEHEYLDDPNLEASFASGGSPFLIDTGGPDRDAVFVGFGVNMLINPQMSAFVRFEQLISNSGTTSAIAGGVTVAF